ncbi:unnamed protein product [Diamesa serratosioi]
METKMEKEECLTDVEEEVILHEIRKDHNQKSCNGGTSTSKDVPTLTRYTITKFNSDKMNNRNVLYSQLQSAIR